MFVVLVYYFASARQTNTAKLNAYFQNQKTTVNTLRVKKTKRTSRNAFIMNLLVFKNGKKSRIDERILFWGFSGSFDPSRDG